MCNSILGKGVLLCNAGGSIIASSVSVIALSSSDTVARYFVSVYVLMISDTEVKCSLALLLLAVILR